MATGKHGRGHRRASGGASDQGGDWGASEQSAVILWRHDRLGRGSGCERAELLLPHWVGWERRGSWRKRTGEGIAMIAVFS